MRRSYAIVFLGLFLSACEPEKQPINGYVEGEFVMVSATTPGLLADLKVARGQQVEKGQPLFSLDTTELQSQYQSAQAQLKQAQYQLDDLTKGARPEDIDVIVKQKQQILANLKYAQKDYQRKLPLAKQDVASQAALDAAKTALDTAKAQLAEINARITSAHLAAREDQIKAAQAGIDSIKQTLAQLGKKLADAAPTAPAEGAIEETYFRQGEFVAAGHPVVSLLPPQNVKIRFFVNQDLVPRLKVGQQIRFDCDGCSAPMTAHINYISNQLEYTPPVIYSVESREKLVVLIEAKPDQWRDELRPGLPVDIDLGEANP